MKAKMNLFETLKNFKTIQPDSRYQETSKRAILAAMPHERRSIGRTIAAIFETGIAAALAVFFILVITGQFSNTPYVSPVQFSVINPKTLNAEAQAVDMQIQLAKITYATPTTTIESTRSMTVAMSTPVAGVAQTSTATSSAAAAATSTPSSTLSIDQALKALSQ